MLASPAWGALRTFTDAGDGLWSTPANWDTGVPIDGDTFAMGVGETAEFDVDQSGFAAGMGASTIAAGTSVVCSTTTGTYHMKMNGDLILAGTDCLKAGTDTSTTLPADVSFTIVFNAGAFSIEGNDNGQALLYCVEPTNKWIRLSGAEAAGQTVLSVDTDVTGDIWADGDEIAIVDEIPNTAFEDVERRTIAGGGIAATTITVTAGLANDKVEGAYVCLLNRNIKITGSTTYAVEDCIDSDVYAFIDCPSAVRSCDNITIGGSIYSTSGLVIYLCRPTTGETLLDCVAINDGLSGDDGVHSCDSVNSTANCLLGGFFNGLDTSRGVIYNGLIVGCVVASATCQNSVINGDIWGCYNGISGTMDAFVTGNITAYQSCFIGGSGGVVVSNCELDSGFCLDNNGSMTLYNVLFTAGTSEFRDYNGSVRNRRSYVESFNHDQVTNAFRAWCRGGIVTSQTASPPTGFTIWYEHACEDVGADISFPCFRQFETVVQPGSSVEVEGCIRIADGEDLSSDPPALQIIDKFADPLVDSTQSPLDEDEIPEPDGGVEAGWQTVSVIWANSGDSPRTVIVRMYANVADVGANVDVDEAWEIADYKSDITKILSVVRPVATTVSTSDTTTSFTLTAGLATADAYNNMTIQVKDDDDADDNWIERSITDWTAGRVVTVDTAFPFTPAVGDKVRITATSYGAASSGTVNANVIEISGDSTAADNLELQYDTTGLAGDTFPSTQAQLANLANVGTAVNQTPASYTLTSGIQSSGTVSNTEELDGVNHEHTDNGGVMDLYYEFTIGSGIPETVVMTGYLNGVNDDLEVYGYDWVSVGWKRIGTLEGKAQSTNQVDAYDMFVNMVGNGADEGKVRVRFTDGAFTLTGATLAIDQIFVSFSLGTEGYDNGAIWINTNASNTNTVVGIDGTARNPVSTIAAANTLSASTNLDRFEVAPGSSFTFAAPQENQTFNGEIWTLALGGQSISGSHIIGADVSGICTGASEPRFFHCHLGSMTIPPSDLESCFLAGTITAGSAGDFFFEKCQSAVAGTSTPVFDYGSGLNASNLNFRMYSGGIHIHNMGTGTGSYNMSLEGFGQLLINSNCSATSTIAIRGHFTITNNATGITLSDLAMFDHNTIIDDILTDTDTTIPTTITTAHTTTDGLVTTVDTVVDGIKAVTDALPDAGALTDIDTGINNIETVVITNAAGVDIAADIIALKAETVLIVEDTGTTLPTAITSAHTTTDALIAALNDLSAAQVNAEVDTALADYDGPTKAEMDAAHAATDALIAALNDLSAAQVWDAVVEGAYSFKDYMRLMMSAIGGKVNGGGTTTITYRDTADTKDRVTYTIDAMGNRTAVTLDPAD